MKPLKQVQLAYLAGLIDGEGSLECQRQMQPRGRTPRYVLRLSFAFATAEPLATLGRWLDLSPKQYPPRGPRRQPTWRMHIPKGLAVLLLEGCLPFLTVKRDQAMLILQIEDVRREASPTRAHTGAPTFQPMPEWAVDRMESLHLRLRSLKSNKRSR